MASNPIEEACERVGELVTLGVFWINWNAKERSEKGLAFGGGSKNCDGEVKGWRCVGGKDELCDESEEGG